MRKLFLCTALASSVLFTSCLGSFSAFNNLKDWNQEVTSNKFVNNLLFWALNIVPVYGLFYFADTVIFNVIEFWSGSNPIAMNEGETETQIVEKNGNTYEMIATKNRMQISIIEGADKGQKVDLVYKPSEKSWNAVKADGEIIKLTSFEEGVQIVYLPDGEEVRVDANATREEGLALINSKMASYEDCLLASAQ